MGKLKAPKPKGYGRLAAPAPSPIDPNTLWVVFGFRYISRGFDLAESAARDGGNFIDGLRMRCHMTWAELRQKDHRGLGCEKISRALTVAIPGHVPAPKQDELLSLRFGADKERFIGFQDGATFEIVWIDHAGECYKH